jgi:lipoprotein-releasing system permease protein
MYKLLLSWRYLRTRWIALASIVSVTLGVATLIVVNAVMSGFAHEMQTRMNGVLSDIVVQSHGLDGYPDPEWHIAEIKKVLGDDLAGISASAEIPGMLSYKFRGQWINRQVDIIGVDEATYANIGDIGKYLLHPANRKQLSFALQEDGYGNGDSTRVLPEMGWPYRRAKAAYEKVYREEQERAREASKANGNSASSLISSAEGDSETGLMNADEIATAIKNTESSEVPSTNPFQKGRSKKIDEGAVFDAGNEQRTGVILGMAMCSVRHRDMAGNVKDTYLCVPGDDVRISFPSAGAEPKPVSELFTVVDYYESKMSEYDQRFAIVPLPRLQEFRGMVDPVNGIRSVTSIQIRLRKGANLEACRDKLRNRFPPAEWPFRVLTWKDMQGSLLAAVQMETTLLNILLFMIIAVAGFGILSTFFMIVVEKTKDIGTLKALGATSTGIMQIFLNYGLSLGAVGGGVGAVLGLLFVININGIAQLIETVTGQEVFDPTIYYFSKIPTIIEPFTVTWVVCGAMLIAVLASVLPALRAARLHPVEALRYE